MHGVMWPFFWIGFVATVFQDLITIVSGEWYYVIENNIIQLSPEGE